MPQHPRTRNPHLNLCTLKWVPGGNRGSGVFANQPGSRLGMTGLLSNVGGALSVVGQRCFIRPMLQ